MTPGWLETARRTWEAFVDAWKVRNEEDAPKRTRLEASFLAPVLEIQEKPPSPTARVTMWIFTGLLFAGLAWAILGETDIVVVATGKIIPDDRTKTVQAITGGIIRQIRVADGDLVSKGQELFVMDPTDVNASIEQVRELIRIARLEAAMHRLLVQHSSEPLENPPQLEELEELKSVPAERLHRRQVLLDEILEAHRNALSEIDKEIRTLMETRASQRELINDAEEMLAYEARLNLKRQQGEQTQIAKIRQLLPYARDEFEALERLHEKQVVSKLKVRQAEEEYVLMQEDFSYRRTYLEQIKVEGEGKQLELRQRIRRHTDRIKELSSNIDTKKESRKRLQSEFRGRHLQEQETSKQNLSRQMQELVKLEKALESHRILSPADGAAQQLALHTEGAVVQPSQVLLAVVPKDPVLEIEAIVENKDIGFVRSGQLAEIKVDTFSYTKYGLLDGEVLQVSADAVENEQMGWVYLARIRLEQTSMMVDGKQIRLSPGMSVSVEIKIGKRRIIEFFLAPLLRAGKESLRER